MKTYQLSRDGEFGTSLKIAPVTTNEKMNDITCLQVNGSSENRIEPQSILPDCRDFQLVGKYENKNLIKYRSVEGFDSSYVLFFSFLISY